MEKDIVVRTEKEFLDALKNIDENTLPDLNRAIDDCDGNVTVGSDLYCARRREERPQGACYSIIPKNLWPLFHACGPERKTGLGNPYEPGEYGP